jgi:large subunit ribosomal protein L21
VTYAVISIGNKQYRVREGQRLLVDRLPYEEGKSFSPDLIMVGGNGEAKLGADLENQKVTAKVAEHVRGKKIIIGKHKRRTGYKRRTGFRASLSRIEIESIGTARAARSTAAKKESATAEAKPAAKKPAAKPATAKKPAAAKKPVAAKKPAAARKPAAKKPAAEKKAPARKPSTRKKKSEE